MSLATAHPARAPVVLEASVEVPAAPLVARSATRFVVQHQTSEKHQTDRLDSSAVR